MAKLFTSLSLPLALLFINIGLGQLEKVQPNTVGVSPERLELLTEYMQEYVDQGKLPGCVVLVTRKGKVFYHEAFGSLDLTGKQPMPTNAIFRIASQTKALISVATMILQEAGRLNIHDPISKYIPEFKESKVEVANEGEGYSVVKAKREITIRDLLTHTAGIGYGYGLAADKWKDAGIQGWYFADREEPILETVKRMASLPMEAHPGEKYVYGYSTDILGAIVEIASGQFLDVFLNEQLLQPLEMNDTYFYLPKEKEDRLASVYSYEGEKLERSPNPGQMVGQGMYVEGPRKSFSGGAGLLSTAMDYTKFLQMMLNKGTYMGNRILSRKSVELMTVDHLGAIEFPWTNGMGFGLGYSIVENLGARGSLGSLGEYGWGGAYHSTYWVDPKEELTVVYFTQVIPANDLDDHEKLRNLLYQALLD